MKKIIIIDDDAINNFLCEMTIKLNFKDIKTESYTNPVDALNYIGTDFMDDDTAILLDLYMPDMDGWQFLEKIKENNIKCRVFILTASVNPSNLKLSKKHPIIEQFLIKPLSKESLRSICKKKNN